MDFVSGGIWISLPRDVKRRSKGFDGFKIHKRISRILEYYEETESAGSYCMDISNARMDITGVHSRLCNDSGPAEYI